MVTARRFATAAPLALALAAWQQPALAQAQASPPVQTQTRELKLSMLGSPFFDAGFIALTTGGIVLGTLVIKPREGDHAPLDGGGHRDHVPEVARASDYAVAVGITTGIALTHLTELGHGAKGLDSLRAPLIVSEGALAGSALTQLLKNVFGVCRPRDWVDAEARCGTEGERGESEELKRAEAHRSFPSGHNAPLAGMAGAALGLYLLPTVRRPEYLPVAITSLGFAGTAVVLRVKGGAHSWVDTGAAFLSGSLAGFAVAALHLQITKSSASPQAAQTGAAGMPLVSYGGAF